MACTLGLASCGDNGSLPPPEPDAGLEPGKFFLTITRRWTDERFDMYVDGALLEGAADEPATMTFIFDTVLDRERTMEVTVELKETGRIVDRRIVRSNCLLNRNFWGPLHREELLIEPRVNGVLWHGGSYCHSRSGGSGVTENGDSTCLAYFDRCEDGRCGFRKASEKPELLQYACTGPGGIPVGDACSFGEPGLDNFDDCEAGSGCVEGMCRRLCYAEYPFTTCETVPEVPCVRLEEFGQSRMGYCDGE